LFFDNNKIFSRYDKFAREDVDFFLILQENR